MPILVKEENDKDDFYKRITVTRDRLSLTKSEAEIRGRRRQKGGVMRCIRISLKMGNPMWMR